MGNFWRDTFIPCNWPRMRLWADWPWWGKCTCNRRIWPWPTPTDERVSRIRERRASIDSAARLVAESPCKWRRCSKCSSRSPSWDSSGGRYPKENRPNVNFSKFYIISALHLARFVEPQPRSIRWNHAKMWRSSPKWSRLKIRRTHI